MQNGNLEQSFGLSVVSLGIANVRIVDGISFFILRVGEKTK